MQALFSQFTSHNPGVSAAHVERRQTARLEETLETNALNGAQRGRRSAGIMWSESNLKSPVSEAFGLNLAFTPHNHELHITLSCNCADT